VKSFFAALTTILISTFQGQDRNSTSSADVLFHCMVESCKKIKFGANILAGIGLRISKTKNIDYCVVVCCRGLELCNSL